MPTVMVEAVGNELKNTQKGAIYTSLKLADGRWINIGGDHRALKGKHVSITEPKALGNYLWANIQKEKPPEQAPNPEPPPPVKPSGNGAAPVPEWEMKTVTEYIEVAKHIHRELQHIEMDAQARAILVNGAMRAWAEGRIT